MVKKCKRSWVQKKYATNFCWGCSDVGFQMLPQLHGVVLASHRGPLSSGVPACLLPLQEVEEAKRVVSEYSKWMDGALG